MGRQVYNIDGSLVAGGSDCSLCVIGQCHSTEYSGTKCGSFARQENASASYTSGLGGDLTIDISVVDIR